MKKTDYAAVIIFCGFLLTFGLLTVLSKDKSFSEDENRVLQQLPCITWERIVSGDYTKEMETYLSDQFVSKRFWTGVKASAQKLTLKQDNNGVFYGKDGYLLEPFRPTAGQLAANSESLARFAGGLPADVRVFGLLAPTSVGMYPEKLPAFAQTDDEVQAIRKAEALTGDGVTWIDAAAALQADKSGQIYFRTDHHWTVQGAYAAYRAAAAEMGLTPYGKEEFDIRTVSNSFKGTFDAKANDPSISAEPLDVFLPKFEMTYRVDYDGDGSGMDSLYDWSFLDKRDKYSLFLGGNHRAVTIRSSASNDRKLLVIKDSYAHSFVPFLANHYGQIEMVDLRYDHRSMRKLIEEEGIDDVLILYNIATFADDQNLIWLRQ
ncbi:hypothetical protein NCCP2716_26690 [Sporosarcina sp. NCCP-2716]|uniref:DHHW family protein n=1 Tax=Sporosarcina sp. NCCP-2716 TaxID=2943679 RepID=UPI00203E88FB|nr:DHHW family protein [Sporosarcina sp. NCCP-2716]GKV70171.1 hypothetical protein NCCP2716_26690 [Sporosarcina sp. NCCP-2716]